jgi:hypothetical protein
VFIASGSDPVTARRVTSLQVLAKRALPAAAFNTDGPRQLVLITCGGLLDARDGSYLDNMAVTALPIWRGRSTPGLEARPVAEPVGPMVTGAAPR